METSVIMSDQEDINNCPGVKSGKSKYSNYLRELQAEREILNQGGTEFSHAERLINQEIERMQNGGKALTKEEKRLVDIIKEKPIRLTLKVLVPVKDHPKFNFVGKLLGPKGNSLKRLQEETLTKMAILGKGSMRDKAKEEELRETGDARYTHLHEDLHVEITTYASPAEAYARIAYALTEVRKFLVPDNNDEIRQEQMREIQLLSKGNSNDSSSPSSSTASNETKPNNQCSNGGVVASTSDAACSHPALRGFSQNAALLLSDSNFRPQGSSGDQTPSLFTSRINQLLNKSEGEGSTSCSILSRLEQISPSASASGSKSSLINLLNKTRNHLSKDDLMTLQALQTRLADITSSSVLQRYGLANSYPFVEFYDPTVAMKNSEYQIKGKQESTLKLQLLQDSLRFQPYSRLLSKTKNS